MPKMVIMFILIGTLLAPGFSYANATPAWSLYLFYDHIIAQSGTVLLPIRSVNGTNVDDLVNNIDPSSIADDRDIVELKKFFATTVFYDCVVADESDSACATLTNRVLTKARFALCINATCTPAQHPPIKLTPVLSAMGEPQWQWQDPAMPQPVRFPQCTHTQFIQALGFKASAITSWHDGMQAGYATPNALVLPCPQTSVAAQECLLTGTTAQAALQHAAVIKKSCGAATQVVLDFKGQPQFTMEKPWLIDASVPLLQLTLRNADITFKVATCYNRAHCVNEQRGVPAIKVGVGKTLRLEHSTISDSSATAATTIGISVQGHLEMQHTVIRDFSRIGILAAPGSEVYSLDSSVTVSGVAVDAYQARLAVSNSPGSQHNLAARGYYPIGLRSRMNTEVFNGGVAIIPKLSVNP